MINVGSDFSGVGAFDMALKRLNIKHENVFACDIDKYAKQTYLLNHKCNVYYNDVYNRPIPIDSLDIYMTSPPCQAFSLAGKREGENSDKGILFYNSLEFITKNKPRFFIFENVKGLLSDNKGITFQNWCALLGGKSINGNANLFSYNNSVPYHIYWQVLNAKDYNIPQNRERVFIVGIRDDSDNKYQFPKKERLTRRLKDILEENVDSKYYLSEKMLEKITFETKNNGEVANLNKGGERGSVYSENTDTISCLTATDYKQPKQIQVGTWRTHKDDYGFRKTKDNNCPTILARAREDGSSQVVLKTNHKIRRLTPLECFRAMDFNEDFIWAINFNNIANSHGILLSLQNKKDIKWNAKELDAIEQQKSKECVCSIIKDGTNTVMKILSSNTPIEVTQNAQLKIVVEVFTVKDIVQNTTILTENGAILYSVKTNNQKLPNEQDKVLLILEEKKGLEEKENRYTDYYLRLSLEENLKEVNTFTILTTIQTITNYLTYIYSIPRENTISVILNYKNYQKSFLKGELLNLKMGNTILSDSQAYKQAGNSICVGVLSKIIQNLPL